MKKSETIGELAKALAVAQKEFTAVVKSGRNPHLGTKYVKLDDIIEMIRHPLGKHGLSFVQLLTSKEGAFVLETILCHESDEWISCETMIPDIGAKKGLNELQVFGLTLTYIRRYALSSFLGISAEEGSDGEKPRKKRASPPKGKTEEKPEPPPKEKAPHWITLQSEKGPIAERFWAWTRDTLGITEREVYIALGVDEIKKFKGTMDDAQARIGGWVKAQAEAEDAQREQANRDLSNEQVEESPFRKWRM